MSGVGQKRKGSDRANVFRFSTESRRGPARLAHPLRARSGPNVACRTSPSALSSAIAPSSSLNDFGQFAAAR